jgi:putative transposase
MGPGNLAPDKKGAQKQRASLLFVDESGLSCIPTLRSTWAPCGQTPRITHAFNWRKLSAISAVSRRGALYFRVHEGAVRTQQVIGFLRHLLAHIRRRPIVLLWDNAPTHRARQVRAFLGCHPRLQVHYLPPYCPEFNPDEWFWAHLKRQELVGLAPHSIVSLRAEISRAVRRMRARPSLIRSFYKASALTACATRPSSQSRSCSEGRPQ